MNKSLVSILVLGILLCFAGIAKAQDSKPLKSGEVLIDWPIVGWQNKSDTGMFLGVGTHLNLIPLGKKSMIGIGTALTLTGEDVIRLGGMKGLRGRTAMVVSLPITFSCRKDVTCLSISPLYEFKRFNWTPELLDTASQSFGIAANVSFRTFQIF